ncbi:MAG: FN3 associated domain-containing protein [Spirochaetota bacterium]
MVKDIEKEKKFILENAGEVPLWNSDDNRKDEEELLSHLKEAAAAKGADFLVTGIFSADKKTLSVECSVYVARISKSIPVKAVSDTGVIIDALIGTLSGSISAEIERNILKPAPGPAILPAEESARYYERISIVPDRPGDEIWYTTDGETPSRENDEGEKYTGSFSVRRSTGIKAVSYREGFYESKTAEKEMTIQYPLRYLTAGIAFPSMYYLGKWGDVLRKTGGSGTSAYLMWECANI